MAYAIAAEVRERINKTGTSDDAILTALIAAAEAAINAYCNRPDGFLAVSTASARVYAGSGTTVLRIDECAATPTEVAAKDSGGATTYTAWAVTDWLAFSGDPIMPDFNHTPYTALMVTEAGDYGSFLKAGYQPTVRVTAKWGYATEVPAQIKEACVAQVARWYKRGQSAWADTLGNAELGQLMYRKVLDPDIEFILKGGRFVRPAL